MIEIKDLKVGSTLYGIIEGKINVSKIIEIKRENVSWDCIITHILLDDNRELFVDTYESSNKIESWEIGSDKHQEYWFSIEAMMKDLHNKIFFNKLKINSLENDISVINTYIKDLKEIADEK